MQPFTETTSGFDFLFYCSTFWLTHVSSKKRHEEEIIPSGKTPLSHRWPASVRGPVLPAAAAAVRRRGWRCPRGLLLRGRRAPAPRAAGADGVGGGGGGGERTGPPEPRPAENCASASPGERPSHSPVCRPEQQGVSTDGGRAGRPLRPPSAPPAALRVSSAALGPQEPIGAERAFPPCTHSACRPGGARLRAARWA